MIFRDVYLAGRREGAGERVGDRSVDVQGTPCGQIGLAQRQGRIHKRAVAASHVVGKIDAAGAVEEVVGNYARTIFVAKISAGVRRDLNANLDDVGEVLLLQEIAVQLQGNVPARACGMAGDCVRHSVCRRNASGWKCCRRCENIGWHKHVRAEERAIRCSELRRLLPVVETNRIDQADEIIDVPSNAKVSESRDVPSAHRAGFRKICQCRLGTESRKVLLIAVYRQVATGVAEGAGKIHIFEKTGLNSNFFGGTIQPSAPMQKIARKCIANGIHNSTGSKGVAARLFAGIPSSAQIHQRETSSESELLVVLHTAY